MTGVGIALASVVAMVLLIMSGLHVAVALILVSFAGVWLLKGSVALAAKMLVVAFKDSIADQLFGVVPLFVLMGLVVSVSGIGRDTFDVAQQAFRRVRGGLGIATIAANAVFAAITGISIASAAVFTKVAVPEMLRHGHTPHFAVGVVAGSSVLGMLIPPSLLFILYGILTEESVGSLFLAGIVPGLLLALTYAAGIVVMGRLTPGFVGGAATADDVPRLSGRAIAAKIAPIAVLILLVLGGLYGGVFTPTEAGAAGAAGALLVAVAKRRLGWSEFRGVLMQTGHVTASICFLIMGASLYSRMLALSGMPGWLGSTVLASGVSGDGVVLAMIAVVILLGTILDSSSIMLLVLPIAVPILKGFGVDLVWLGVVAVLAVEIGLLTPPFGIAVYVIKATLEPGSGITLGQIFLGAAPFAAMMLLVLALVFLFPSLATFLL
ncbi:TRAP transporter large permease [Azospirillum sp. ST 5-10]|uniref:TRAP transporter large permease n=1 Tax=unclassified Azospirillum TaxID=2630922 RepID=UPI003F4A608A